MQKYSAWEDAIYTFTATTYTVFYLYDENNTLVYAGKASPRPDTGIIEINVSQIVRNYLNSYFPITAFSGDTFQEGQHYLPDAVLGFTLTDEKGNVWETYKFLNCWDYKTRYSLIDNVGMSFSLNQAVNNHTVSGQYTFASVLTKTNKVRVNIGSTLSPTACNGYGALYYSNSLGGWDSFLIEGNMKKTNKYSRYEIDNPFRAGTLQFGHRIINNTIEETWELQTQYLDDNESKRLTDNLFGSTCVFFHDFNEDKIYPVVITDTSVEVKTWRNQKRKHYIYKINIKNAQDKQRI